MCDLLAAAFPPSDLCAKAVAWWQPCRLCWRSPRLPSSWPTSRAPCAEREIQTLEVQLIEAKKARTAQLRHASAQRVLLHLRQRAAPDDAGRPNGSGRCRSSSAMIYGDEGFFFVYDYDGTNAGELHARLNLINRNHTGADRQRRDARGCRPHHALPGRATGYLTPISGPSHRMGRRREMITYVTSFPVMAVGRWNRRVHRRCP